MKPIIQTQALRFTYPGASGETAVLDGVDLEIKAGSFVAILGRNGSGKSTLAKHTNAILLPSGGKVYVDGIDTAQEDKLLDIRRTVGMVFQNPDNQIVANVVEEDVAFAPENLGVPPEEIRRRVDSALQQVGMYDYRTHAPHLLSGGQKQRVAIAGIIAMQPRCIVLDEPTAMLDPIGREEVLKTIRTLNHTSGVTVVLITHHMEEAAQADRVVVLSKGKLVADGPPDQVFSQVEALRAIGLEVPETTGLLWELRQEGLPLPLDALSDEACAAALYALLCGAKDESPVPRAGDGTKD
ncbi:MAG: energy-coupling factor transporter ATPase [Oscillospiraceae bacterium]|nr:energy-coupling factor transporter ATPase [Oscillospiraceae bacterium]